MRIDIMTDIEALGNKTDSTIFQISAIAFDIHTGEHIDIFNRISDIAENKEMNVTGDTIIWWLNTDKELLTELLNKGEGSSENILREFHQWLLELSLKGELHLWGNGILFDNKLIQHQLEKIGLTYPIHYKKDRDVRTIVDLTAVKLGTTEEELKERFNEESLTPHDAFDDVKYQINLVTWCYKELTSK